MSSLGHDNLINCQVAPAGRMVILTCKVLLSHSFGISLAYRVAHADHTKVIRVLRYMVINPIGFATFVRIMSVGSYSLRGT